MKLQSPLAVSLVLLATLLWSSHEERNEVMFAKLERSATRQWEVSLSVSPATVEVENLALSVSVKSSRSGYLTLLQRGTDGVENMLFPNALDGDNRIEEDQPLFLPRSGWKLRAAPPAGNSELLALVSEKPVDTNHLDLAAQPYGAAKASYREH